MNFQINNTDLLTEPSDHGWQKRTALGYAGNAHAVYPAPRSYFFKFDWVDAASFAQLVGFYNMCSGTIQASLPMWNSSTGGFASYNGVLEEPSYSSSFEGFYGSVQFLLIDIK
jgi:hypothetical protein